MKKHHLNANTKRKSFLLLVSEGKAQKNYFRVAHYLIMSRPEEKKFSSSKLKN